MPGNASLARLDQVIQTAMGWTNSHAHMFEFGSVRYGDPEMGREEDVQDERKVRLAAREVGSGTRPGIVVSIATAESKAPRTRMRLPRNVVALRAGHA